MEMTEEEKEATEILTSIKHVDASKATLVYNDSSSIIINLNEPKDVTYVVVPEINDNESCTQQQQLPQLQLQQQQQQQSLLIESDSSVDVEAEDESWQFTVITANTEKYCTKKNRSDKVRSRRTKKSEDVEIEIGDCKKSVTCNELTKLEDNVEQVAARLAMGCDCSHDCFVGLDPERVYRHRLNIADLTKAEHSMYLQGVLLASMQVPDESKKDRGARIKSSYNYQGRKVCLTAFLYLEHVTLYQVKRLRKHLMYHGVSPRIHGNQGRKPANTLPLDIYQHAAEFVKSFIEKHHVKQAKTMPGTTYHLPGHCTKKTLHDEYRTYCGSDIKPMQYSTFTAFFKKQFPNVKFQKLDRGADYRLNRSRADPLIL